MRSGACLKMHEPAVTVDVPGPGAVARRAPVKFPRAALSPAPLPAALLAVALVVVWLAVDPRTPDLAAQVYRVGLFRQIGMAVFDEHWYAGHHLPGYSLLYPALGALLGVRAVGALCVPLSTVSFGLLLSRSGLGCRAAGWPAAAFALAASGDVWQGRLAFALGVSLALAAGVLFQRRRTVATAAFAALAAAASPVAGLLLGLAALSLAVHQRRVRALLALALPAALVVVPLNLLFPEGGSEPFPAISFAVTAGLTVAFLLALPPGSRLLRTGGLLYLASCVLFLLASSPVGSNIERYGVLLAGPLLLAALLGGQRRGAARNAFAWLVLAAIATWVLWGPVRETEAVAGSPATSAAYYAPLERFLDSLGGGPVRVEVPLTRSHWEAALLAPHVSLARGWDKQLDVRYDGVLLDGRLDAASYRAWLASEAVAYVALPDVQLDPSSAAEGRLIRSGLPYLRLVFASRHWRVFKVLDATPLLTGPGRLTRLGHDSFELEASRAAPLLVRVRYTPYWVLTAGEGCVGRGPEGFTEVRPAAPGRVFVEARFSLGRAFGSASACRG